MEVSGRAVPEVKFTTVSSGLMVQVSWLEFTKVVAISLLLNTIMAPWMKLLPSQVSRNEAVCDSIEVGEIDVKIGVGILASGSQFTITKMKNIRKVKGKKKA